jgi:hypothetical protein
MPDCSGPRQNLATYLMFTKRQRSSSQNRGQFSFALRTVPVLGETRKSYRHSSNSRVYPKADSPRRCGHLELITRQKTRRPLHYRVRLELRGAISGYSEILGIVIAKGLRLRPEATGAKTSEGKGQRAAT